MNIPKILSIKSEKGFTLNFSDSTAISSMHLTDLAAVVTLLAQVSIYRAHMNDEDKDYHDAIVWWLEEYPKKSWREE